MCYILSLNKLKRAIVKLKSKYMLKIGPIQDIFRFAWVSQIFVIVKHQIRLVQRTDEISWRYDNFVSSTNH